MKTHQQLSLQFKVFNQLKDAFEELQAFIIKLSDINNSTSANESNATNLISQGIIEVATNFQLTGYKNIKEEIDENIFLIDNSNQGVYYIVKWADLVNDISRYTYGAFHKKHLPHIAGMLDAKYDLDVHTCFSIALIICFELAKIEDVIVKILPKLVWYKEHTDLIKIDALVYSDSTLDSNEKGNDQFPLFHWKGKKTDLAELIWVLSKSLRIVDSTTGEPITMKKLTSQFETMFDIDLDVVQLMKARMSTYKAGVDEKTFIASLYDIVKERSATT